jgi:hypothetical protein
MPGCQRTGFNENSPKQTRKPASLPNHLPPHQKTAKPNPLKNPNEIHKFTNSQIYKSLYRKYWNFDKLQDSVTIKCEDKSEIGSYENLPFWSGISLGVGSSLMITSLYDGLRKRSEKAEKYAE